MKTLKPSLLLIALTFLLLTGMKCKKDTETTTADTLPPETQKGANTFGCLVDGKVFKPMGNFTIPGLSAVIQFEILNLSARRTSTQESVLIALRGFNKVGEYPMNNEILYALNHEGYEPFEGKVTITKYDTINKIVSGRFYFTAKNEQTGKTVSITDGRFDVKYTD